MYKFDKHQIEDLKQWLLESNVHDSQIYFLKYDQEKGILKLRMFNPFFDVGINFIFEEVMVFLSINSDELSNRKTVLGVTVEDDFSYLQNCTGVCDGDISSSLYLLFEIVSGDQLHIVCKNVIVGVTE